MRKNISLIREVKNDEPNHVNIFLIHSPLHYLISEYIVRHLGGDAQNYLFCTKHSVSIMPSVCHKYWTFAGEIPSPRKHPHPGFWGRYKCIVSNLKQVVAQLPSNSRNIYLHVNSIRNTYYNFFINYLRHCFPDSELRVRLLMDGVSNIAQRPLSISVRLKQPIYKSILPLKFPELNYYRFQGDITGIDADIVDRLYLLKGFPNEYSPEKIYYLSLDKDQEKIKKENGQILVLGNPAFKNLCQKMLDWAFVMRDGKEIIYKPHRAEYRPPLFPENCRLASFSEPLEVHLMKNNYSMIVGITSTGLITARQLCGKKTHIVSYGMNYCYATVKTKERKLLKQLNNIFYKMNIECIETK